MKKPAKIIRNIIILFLIVALFYYKYFYSRTIFNDEDTLGNTAGNLYNNGLFCEYKDTIYFSNFNDDGALYSMSGDLDDFKILSHDRAEYINVAGPYLYYSRNNQKKATNTGQILDFNNTGIYRINRKTGRNMLRLYDDPAGLISLCGNYIYYQHYNKEIGLQFYMVKIDGTDESEIKDEPIAPASFQNHALIFNGMNTDHSIYQMNLDSHQTDLIYDGSCYQPIATSDYIYFTDLSRDHGIARILPDGSDYDLLVKDFCSSYNVSTSGRYLYYQKDNSSENGLYRYDTYNDETLFIRSGDYNSINILTNYVFFKEYDTDQVFWFTDDNPSEIHYFDPPVLKKKR